MSKEKILTQAEKRKNLSDLIFKKSKEEKVILTTIDGFMEVDLDNLVNNQSVDGLLYDLNRDLVTCLTCVENSEDIVWVNNTASGIVIEYMSKQIDILRATRDEWKADAMALAKLVEEQLNAYDLMGRDGVTGITDEGYLKLERALMDHNSLAEKDRETKWRESTKRVLEENRGAWEELGKEEKK